MIKSDWLIDCTDNNKSQIENQKIAEKHNYKYLKAGYDGENISINNKVAEWGESKDGYQIVPSWVVPATIIASLTIAKVMKYNNKEITSNIKKLFKIER